MQGTRRLVLVLTGIAVALVIVIGGIAAALLAGGDGGDEEEAGQTPGATRTPAAAATPLPPKEAGELRLFGPDPLTLDPALANDAASAQYIVEIFSGLVTFDQQRNIVPDIAERWDISPDGTVYTFHLRRGVLFHDRSRQVTATDFKYSMQRVLDPETLSTIALVYLGDIVGAQEFAAGRADEVRGIKVSDTFTLEITIDAPKPYFLAKMTYPTAFVVKREQVEGNRQGWTRRPIGTGPFKLDEWRLGERITLVPNDQYYLEPKPSLSKVTFLLAGGSSFTMYENGEVDITGVGVDDVERVRDASDPLNKEFHEGPSLDTSYIGFNVEKPPFDDVKVRQAFTMAIDKDTLARVVLRDLVVVAKGILPPDMPGYVPNLEGLPFDPQRARQLLAESKYGGRMPDITWVTSGQGGTAGPIVDAILAMWKDNLGVTVTVEQEEFGLFLSDLDGGKFQLFDLAWIADYIDPQNFLEIKFYSQNVGSTNETRYKNDRVDALLEQAQTEQDPQRRYQIYQEAEKAIVQDAPWVPLFHGKNSYLVKPYVQGYEAPPLVIPHFRYVTIQGR